MPLIFASELCFKRLARELGKEYDEGGAHASRGSINQWVLEELIASLLR